MNESRIKTTQNIEHFLLGGTNVSMSLEGNKQDVYNSVKNNAVVRKHFGQTERYSHETIGY